MKLEITEDQVRQAVVLWLNHSKGIKVEPADLEQTIGSDMGGDYEFDGYHFDFEPSKHVVRLVEGQQ